MDMGRHLGHSALELLAEDWSIAIMRELVAESLRPIELGHRIADIHHSVLMRRLAEMVEKGIASRERYSDIPPRTRYALTGPGRLLLDVPDAAERWERRWAGHHSTTARPGALGLIGDQRFREILLALAAGPLCPNELQQQLRSVGRSALRKRLTDLVRQSILTRRQEHGTVVYELTEGARHLAQVAARATRWEWEWSRPRQPVPARNIPGVLHLFAPLAQLPAGMDGVCKLHVDADPGGTRDIYLAAAAGSVTALDRAPPRSPRADCHATPQGWFDALLLSRLSGISTCGDRRLMASVVVSVAAALLGGPAEPTTFG